MYKYNLGLKKSHVNTRRLFAIMCDDGDSSGSSCSGCDYCLL